MSVTTPNPKNRKRKKVHGFRSRSAASNNILRDRRRKGRKKLSA